MRLRSPSWALIDQRGYQPSLRREDPSLLWRFEAGAGVRSQNAEDHDGGFCFLPCGLVEPPSWDRREMRAETPVHSHRFAWLARLRSRSAMFATTSYRTSDCGVSPAFTSRSVSAGPKNDEN